MMLRLTHVYTVRRTVSTLHPPFTKVGDGLLISKMVFVLFFRLLHVSRRGIGDGLPIYRLLPYFLPFIVCVT